MELRGTLDTLVLRTLIEFGSLHPAWKRLEAKRWAGFVSAAGRIMGTLPEVKG